MLCYCRFIATICSQIQVFGYLLCGTFLNCVIDNNKTQNV
jgi:hypothetical protein